MKKILSISGLLLSSMFIAQVIINPGAKTSVSSPSVSLEFGNEGRGLILPYVEGAGATTAVAGTLIMDPADKKVKLKLADGTWQNLSGAAQVSNTIITMPGSIQENFGAQVIISSNTITPAQVPGVLILADADKAMILPKVSSPHLNIKNPAPGMLVYDSAEKMLAVFNGTQWAFWKP